MSAQISSLAPVLMFDTQVLFGQMQAVEMLVKFMRSALLDREPVRACVHAHAHACVLAHFQTVCNLWPKWPVR